MGTRTDSRSSAEQLYGITTHGHATSVRDAISGVTGRVREGRYFAIAVRSNRSAQPPPIRTEAVGARGRVLAQAEMR